MYINPPAFHESVYNSMVRILAKLEYELFVTFAGISS